MPKFFVKGEQIKNEIVTILESDVNHIKNVLRLNLEDEIQICDTSNRQNYLCQITEMKKDIINCKIIKALETKSESNVQVSIFQGIPKAEKMELIIQKSVELGAYNIIPTEMNRCVVKINDSNKKIQRWQKISEVAAKQCGRNIIPEIKPIINVKNVCNLIQEYDIVLIAYEKEKINKLRYEIQKLKEKALENYKIAIIIGPEGGIEENEIELLIENGAKAITLGNRILRTETVALNMLSVLMYELEK